MGNSPGLFGDCALSAATKRVVLQKLADPPGMDWVWKKLEEESANYQEVSAKKYLWLWGVEQSYKLAEACLNTLEYILNNPLHTKSVYEAASEKIANNANELHWLLCGKYIDNQDDLRPAKETQLSRLWALPDSNRFTHSLWEGNLSRPETGFWAPWCYRREDVEARDQTFEFLQMLRVLWSGASVLQERPIGEPQARTPLADQNCFIDSLSGYFKTVYGRDFHKAVGIISSSLFEVEVSESRVKQLMRGRVAATKKNIQNKPLEFPTDKSRSVKKIRK